MNGFFNKPTPSPSKEGMKRNSFLDSKSQKTIFNNISKHKF